MRLTRSLSFVSLSFTLFAGCGGDTEAMATDATSGSGTEAGEATGDGDTTTGDGDTTSGDGDTTTGDGDTTSGDGDGTTGDGTTGDGTTGDGDGCMAWEITYDLDGSEFEIADTPLGAGNQVNTVAAPYDAGDTVGPGMFVLQFQDVGGSPGGLAAMIEHTMSIHFVVDSGFTNVATDLEGSAGPVACGITTGTLAGDTVSWMPSEVVDYHSVGQILCNGALCSVGGLPDGMPVLMDETGPQPVSDFVFSGDRSSFTMAKTVVAMDSNSTTSWTYLGTEVSRALVAAPACMCP